MHFCRLVIILVATALLTHCGSGSANDEVLRGLVFDPDHDKVVSFQDNCPGTANPDQADLDSDGRGNMCDFKVNWKTSKFNAVSTMQQIAKP